MKTKSDNHHLVKPSAKQIQMYMDLSPPEYSGFWTEIDILAVNMNAKRLLKMRL